MSNDVIIGTARKCPKNRTVPKRSPTFDQVRRMCLERAKLARKERFSRQRILKHDDGDISYPILERKKRARSEEETLASRLDKLTDSSASDDLEMVDTAKSLVEQQIQQAIRELRYEELNRKRQTRMIWGWNSESRNETCASEEQQRFHNHANDEHRNESKISPEEYEELLQEVMEELHREEELQEAQFWEMERFEALEHEQFLDQIDEYYDNDWEEQLQQASNSNMANNQQPLDEQRSLVPCPICQSAQLVETPLDGIQCLHATRYHGNCSFQLDVAHEGLGIRHLQERLNQVYNEHFQMCTCAANTLKFRVEDYGGMNMLLAACDTCAFSVIVM